MKKTPFPKSGTYNEQKQFIDSLPVSTKNDDLHEAVTLVRNSKNPLSCAPTDFPENLSMKIYQHQANNAEKEYSSSDSENEETIPAVITREVTLSNQKKREEMYVHVPADGKDQVFRMKADGEGNFRVTKKKDMSIVQAMQGLNVFSNNEKRKQGFIVQATREDDNEQRYTEFSSPK